MTRSLRGHLVTKSPQVLGGVPTTLTEEQQKKILKQHDRDGDGQLNTEELAQAFRQMGTIIPAHWRAERAMSYADSDKNGVLTVDEFQQLVNYVHNHGFTIQGIDPI